MNRGRYLKSDFISNSAKEVEDLKHNLQDRKYDLQDLEANQRKPQYRRYSNSNL